MRIQCVRIILELCSQLEVPQDLAECGLLVVLGFRNNYVKR